MKIISSFIDELLIKEGQYHSITFQSSFIQSQFREMLSAYFRRRVQADHQYLHILNEDGKKVKSNDFCFITFDCNVINLHEEKNTKQLLQDLLYYYLENNPALIQDYLNFNENVINFINRIEIVSDDLKVDFQPSEKTIAQLIKSLNISIEYKESAHVPNYIMRIFLIQSLLKMNVTEKNVFLLISYPETDMGSKDYEKFIEMLKKLQVTTLILTTHPNFLSAAGKESMFLVDKNGKLYDTIKLHQELISLGKRDNQGSSLAAKILAVRDFNNDYFLLDNNMKEFLKSSRC